jgi:polyphosphate kinase 2
MGKKKKHSTFTRKEAKQLLDSDAFFDLAREKGLDPDEVRETLEYEDELERLQIQLVKLYADVQAKGRRVVILFEGRDAAGKGGSIRRFIEHLNPRGYRVVALSKPTEVEQGQWYFQRYVAQLPAAGEICFFDRSWYNRAVVEPVNGFCTPKQYQQFMKRVAGFEHSLVNDGIELIKFWFEIDKAEQAERFEARRKSPLKSWKIGPVDAKAQKLWDKYTAYQKKMLRQTHSKHAPWTIVQANSKKKARLGSLRHVLHTLDYQGKKKAGFKLAPDPKVIAPPKGK